jgi:hypothetical protein
MVFSFDIDISVMVGSSLLGWRLGWAELFGAAAAVL